MTLTPVKTAVIGCGNINGELGYHVLDTMHAVLEASNAGQHIELTSTFERPAPLPAGLPEYQLEK